MSSSPLPKIETAEQRRALWEKVKESGGIDPYIKSDLESQDFYTGGQNPSSMNKKQKSQYKENKRKEAEHRKGLKKCVWQAYRETHLVHLGEGVFYNDLVDFDKYDLEKREQRIEQNGIPAINNPNELAEFLGLSLPTLRWLCYHRNADTGTHYARFTIPKSDGSERVISAPKPKLKAAQRKILSDILEALPIHGAAHGFVPGRSIATHAQLHAGAKVIIKLDVKDFFPTIVLPRVKGLFRKMGYPEQVATLLALLCTESPRKEVEHDGTIYHVAMGPRSLPQGAPTSPTLTNLLCVRMDRRLTGLARKYNWTYSRYADDLAFSWHNNDAATIGSILNFGKSIIGEEGFRVHPKKQRVLRSKSRQILTGLVVNHTQKETQQARVPRKVVRQIRAAIYNHQQGRPTKPGETLEQLRGLAAFVHQSDPEKGRLFLDQIQELINRRDEAY